MTKWILAEALILMAFSSRGMAQTKETQPPASTQVEEIYVVRSVPEALITPPTGFCVQERIGFGGTRGEGRFTFRSTAEAADGRMSNTNLKTIGSIHVCSGAPTTDPGIDNWYAEGALGSIPFKGIGKCSVRKRDFPERGVLAFNCFLDLSGLPSGYVGGLLTTNSILSTSLKVGLESDPPGYTQNSIATIRLWRKRDASSSAVPLTKESLVGAWKLVSLKNINDKGEGQDGYGPNPVGFLTYTADGRFSVIIADSRRKPLPVGPTASAETLSEVVSTFFAYAGSYTFTGDKVTHHIEICLIQILANTDQVRSVKLNGDRLTLRGVWRVSGATSGSSEVVWERLKPETAGK